MIGSKNAANLMGQRAFQDKWYYMGWDGSCDTYGSATALLRWVFGCLELLSWLQREYQRAD